jgi:RNA recognition motif-containing protein
MGKRLYVGNLSYDAFQEDLEEMFKPFGTIVDVHLVLDRNTGRSRGFGFVEMGTEDEAQKAVDGLDGTEVMGRVLKVNIARPREQRGGGGGGGRDGGRGWMDNRY